MTTQPYIPSLPSGYGAPLGARLLALLQRTGVDPFTAEQARHEGMALGLTEAHTRTLLHQLAASGWITRLKKGCYALNSPVTGQPVAHPFALATALVTPSAVSHWSALNHWGLTEQIPHTVMVSSPRRTFPPANETAPDGRPAAWMAGGVRCAFVAITAARYFGVTQVWINERNRVPIFDRERALLDAFQHFHIFGSLSVALDIVDDSLPDLHIDRLVQYAVRLDVAAVVKRLGWVLAEMGAPATALEPLRDYPAKGDSPLDPTRPARGRHNAAWQVIENLHD